MGMKTKFHELRTTMGDWFSGPRQPEPETASLDGTYGGRRDEKKRLQALGYDVHGHRTMTGYVPKTDSAHLVDHVNSFPFPHLPRRSVEGSKAEERAIAYNEDSRLHRRHVSSYYDERSEGYVKDEHAWTSPAKYRADTRTALRDDVARRTRTNISNVIQLNLLEFAHVQNYNSSAGSTLGLYRRTGSHRQGAGRGQSRAGCHDDTAISRRRCCQETC